MAQIVCDADLLTPGEIASAVYLKEHLPGDWLVIVGRELVHPSGAVREVDFIIIGHHLVFAVEEKAWHGKLFGNDHSWVLSSGESRRSPLNQAYTVARPLAGRLRHAIPGVRQTIGNAHFVYPAVLLSDPKARVLVHDPRCAQQVWKLPGCEQKFHARDKDAKNHHTSIIQVRESIVRHLTELPDRPEIPKRINAYRVVESLGTTGPIRAYAAEHDDGSRHTLKLLPRPNTLSAATLEQEKRALLREYDTLRTLEGAGIAPKCDRYFYWQDDEVLVVPMATLPGKTLRADRALAEPRADDLPGLFTAGFTALSTLHEAGIVHRGLSPDRVWRCDDGKVRFSDFVASRLPNAQTIADMADWVDPPDPYRAPECRLNPALAEPASDVYCLCATLLFWISGLEPDERGDMPDWIPTLHDQLGRPYRKLLKLCQRCLVEDDRKRPPAAKVAQQARKL